MRLFKRRETEGRYGSDGLADVLWWARPTEQPEGGTAAAEGEEPEAGEHAQPIQVPEPEDTGPEQIRVARTLVMSEPELTALLASDPRLQGDGLRVELVEKGFGTRMAIYATPESGFAEADLEALLDDLAEPQKRPFTNS